MKAETIHRRLGQEGFTETLEYDIEATGLAFDTLFKKMYTEPIRAVLRELGTNAYDSHVQAGCPDKPFDIKLPSSLDCLYYIRDYGSGMDGDEIRDVYRVVFRSTKTKTNDQVGCFGLGCKTPFAYTDNYTIESYKNGKKWVINSFMNDEGKPSLGFVVDGEPTTEPNGLKVIIPCKSEDITTWVNTTQTVFQYFKVKPNVLGNRVVFTNQKYTLEGTDWGIRSDNSYSRYNHIICVMGQIPYQVDINYLKNLSDIERSIVESGVDVFFDIGQLSIQPNREYLNIDDRTNAAIKLKLNVIASEIEKKCSDKIQSSDCLWNARITFNQLSDSVPYYIWHSLDKSKIKFNNKPLYTKTGYRDHILYDKTNFSVFCVNIHYKKPKLYESDDITASDDIAFYLDDADAIESRIKYKESQTTDRKSYIIVKEINPGGLQNFIDQAGILPSMINKISDLPKPPRQKYTRKQGKTSKVNKLDFDKSGSFSWDKEIEIDLKKDGGFYVELNRYDAIYKYRQHPLPKWQPGDPKPQLFLERKIKPDSLKDLVKSLDTIGYPVNTIYGVKSAHIQKLGQGWTNYFKYAKVKTEDFLSKVDPTDFGDPYRPYNYSFVKNFPHLLRSLSSEVEKDTDFRKAIHYVNKHKRYNIKNKLYNSIQILCQFFDLKFEKKGEDYSNQIKSLMQSYPLLDWLQEWRIDNNAQTVEHLKAYIDCISKRGN